MYDNYKNRLKKLLKTLFIEKIIIRKLSINYKKYTIKILCKN